MLTPGITDLVPTTVTLAAFGWLLLPPGMTDLVPAGMTDLVPAGMTDLVPAGMTDLVPAVVTLGAEGVVTVGAVGEVDGLLLIADDGHVTPRTPLYVRHCVQSTLETKSPGY